MAGNSRNWKIDPRLEADTIPVHSGDRFETRLMNDRRWPWLIVVPVLPDAEDIDDCPVEFHTSLMAHLCGLSAGLKEMGVCSSTNVATLGNMVRQMHWHVIGRSEGDPNWPQPVWGFEKPVPYAKEEAETFISALHGAYPFPS